MNKQVLMVVVVLVLLVAGGAYWVMANPGAVPQLSPSQTDTALGTDTTNQAQAPVTSADGQEPGQGGIHGMEPEPAAAAARADLAAKLGVAPSGILIALVEEKTWSDGCLGLGGPAEACLAALIDGFRVELRAQGKEYVYRTDKTGASVRMEVQ